MVDKLQLVEKSLECMVCRDMIRPPIILCLTGHSICSTCKSKISNCPVCKNGWSTTRCFALEKIADAFKFKCKYFEGGCNKEELLNEITKHEEVCEFIDRPCPVKKGHNCEWNGPVCKIEAHLKDTTYINYSESIQAPYESPVADTILKGGTELFRASLKRNKNLTTWSFVHISATPYKKPLYQVEITFTNQINDGSVLKFVQSCNNWLNIKHENESKGVILSDELLLPFVDVQNKIQWEVKFHKISS